MRIKSNLNTHAEWGFSSTCLTSCRDAKHLGDVLCCWILGSFWQCELQVVEQPLGVQPDQHLGLYVLSLQVVLSNLCTVSELLLLCQCRGGGINMLWLFGIYIMCVYIYILIAQKTMFYSKLIDKLLLWWNMEACFRQWTKSKIAIHKSWQTSSNFWKINLKFRRSILNFDLMAWNLNFKPLSQSFEMLAWNYDLWMKEKLLCFSQWWKQASIMNWVLNFSTWTRW